VAEALYALGIIVLGLIVGKLVSVIALKLNAKSKFSSRRSIRTVLRAFRTAIFLLSIVIALGFLRVEFAEGLWIKFIEIMPKIFVLILVWLLGYAVISLIFDFASHAIMHYADDYLKEFAITKKTASVGIFIMKVFLLLIFAAISLKIADLDVPIINSVIIGLVFSFMAFIVLTTTWAFKDYLANFLLSTYVARNIVKPGQHLKIDGNVGEVITVTNHGVVILFDNGYQTVIPNTQIVREELTQKRVRTDIHKLERLVPKYMVQLPAFCGPASTAMLLNFFGYNVTQEQVAKIAKTRAPPKEILKKNYTTGDYGNEPEELIRAVRKITRGEVKGKLVKYGEISDLHEEVKVWLTEGALPILWYKKPVLFPEKPSRAGHYVLGVGVEDEEIIVMDPSSQTEGVYMVNYELMEDAMAEHDKERGYIIFAKNGSPAYWRLTEGLYYSDATAYKQLSKSFERYLKKAIRQTKLVKEFTSPFVEFFFEPDKEKIKHIWKPDIGGRHAKKK